MKKHLSVLGVLLVAALMVLPGAALGEMYIEGYLGGNFRILAVLGNRKLPATQAGLEPAPLLPAGKGATSEFSLDSAIIRLA